MHYGITTEGDNKSQPRFCPQSDARKIPFTGIFSRHILESAQLSAVLMVVAYERPVVCFVHGPGGWWYIHMPGAP